MSGSSVTLCRITDQRRVHSATGKACGDRGCARVLDERSRPPVACEKNDLAAEQSVYPIPPTDGLAAWHAERERLDYLPHGVT